MRVKLKPIANPRMKHLSILTILFLLFCGVPQAEYQAVALEKRQLQEENDQLKGRIAETTYLAGYSQGRLPDTELKEIHSSLMALTAIVHGAKKPPLNQPKV